MDKLISVVVPIYNVEKYLEKCVESILEQTYRNLEIILVDDGSTDRSSAICDAYARKDSRIKVIHQRNAGLSAARNTGIKEARGEYIGFIDSDDYVEPSMYEDLLKLMLSEHADLAIGNVCRVDEEGYLLEDPVNVPKGVYTKNQILHKITEEGNVYFITAWNKLYKKEIFDKVLFPVGKIHEDEFVIHEVIDSCEKIVTTNKVYYYYVQRENSIMSQYVSIKRFDAVEAIHQRFLYYKKQEEVNDCLLAVCNQCLDVYVGLMSRMQAKECRKERKRLAEAKKTYRSMYKEIAGVSKLSLKKKIKYYFPNQAAMLILLKEKLCLIKRKLKCFRVIYRILKKNKEYKYVLLDTPEHGNLGDHAIVLAQQQFVDEVAGKNKYLELTAEEINENETFFAKFISKDKTIILPGGGFLGDLWLNEEYRVHRILQAFPENKIIIFPQTIYYDLDSMGGRKFLELSQSVYAKHSNLTIFAREKRSYEFLKQYFPSVHSHLVPDIVLFYQHNLPLKKREGILFCMRSDKERNIEDSEVSYITEGLKQKFEQKEIRYTDTVVNYNIKPADRTAEVNKKLNEFASAELVITDRLHGMIFAAITGTPCIAFGNSSGKVKGVYEWIKNLEYVQYADTIEDFENALEKIDLKMSYKFPEELLHEVNFLL